MLQRPHLSAEALAQIGQLIEEALRWSPNDEYTWTFWADWCAYQGQQTHQEWVLRELVRLFPNNEIGRVELARLLINGGKSHWPEAEYWLREAAERNPEKSLAASNLPVYLSVLANNIGQRQKNGYVLL